MDEYDRYKPRLEPDRTRAEEPYDKYQPMGNQQGSREVYGGTVRPSSYQGGAGPST